MAYFLPCSGILLSKAYPLVDRFLRRSGYRLLVLLVLGIFLSVRISPVLSQIPVIQSQKVAEESVKEESNCYENEKLSEALEDYQEADKKYQKVINNDESIQEKLQELPIKAKLNRLSLLLEKGKWKKANDLSSEININDLPKKAQSRVYARINYAKSLACLQQKYPQAIHSWADITDQIHEAIEESKNLEAKRDLEDKHLLS